MSFELHENVKNFCVVAIDNHEGMGDFNRGVARYGARNTFYVTGVATMAQQVRKRCLQTNSVIGDLVLQAHGDPGGISIGKDYLFGDNFTKYSAAIDLMRRHVAPGFTHVKLFSCETGADDGLIRAWSKQFDNTPVSAPVSINYDGTKSLSSGWEGQVKTAMGNTVISTPATSFTFFSPMIAEN